MTDEDKVFLSKIDRGNNSLKNDLFELISFSQVTPKTNISQNDSDNSCDFTPKTGKLYAPKTRASTLAKVKTVRDVRKEYEKDVYEYLPAEIEKKEAYLLKKIRHGIGRNLHTNTAATNILKYRQPISRSGWQMVMNINPLKHVHPKQFLLYNGNILQVNGSKGGERKFLLQFDLGRNDSKLKPHKNFITKKKITLLKNSLNIKFKPGPLSRKKQLDNSFQRHILGDIHSITLPKIVLDIEPLPGVPLEPTISNIIHSLEHNKGKMSEKWANYAASALEIKEKNVQNMENNTISFKLNYENSQNQVLMRSHKPADSEPIIHTALSLDSDADIRNTVQLMLNDIVSAVDISLKQDSAFIKEDEPRPRIIEDCNIQQPNCNAKDKVKKKFNELQKLDVTVIRLSEAPLQVKSCTNEYCKLGCICPSLSRTYSLKTHCGRLECMFQCTCDVSKFGFMNSEKGECPEWMPGLINLDNQINSKLAKEEKDFHQTVVLTDDKSIVIKSHRRNLKTPKRYDNSYNGSKPSFKTKPVTISVRKLDLSNLEPWCMVHSLYQCFCNCKFTDGVDISKLKELEHQNAREKQIIEDTDPSHEIIESETSKPIDCASEDDDLVTENFYCSRTSAFKRRFGASQYKEINSRIVEMEKNDTNLKTRLYQVINGGNLKLEVDENTSESASDKDVEIVSVAKSVTNISAGSAVKFGGKKKLIAWLEANYKIYKDRIECGKPIPLEAPKLGKMALYPWEVILDRYKSKKNYFLVTKTEPYRVFIAVNRKNPFFSNCVGIDELSFDEVKRCPITVRNLLYDADDIKDNFYILCGLSTCWELIGCVTKLNDKNIQRKTPNTVEISDDDSSRDTEPTINQSTHSKWLYILVENDFSEIQFLSKGFFVKFENIIKATNLSRTTGKTVRLSSQNNSKDFNTPHFGIYAIPDPMRCSVFVGPYDLDENLDIETVLKMNEQSKDSKGIWVYVEKKENTNVIDNILKYIPNIHNDDSTKHIALKYITNSSVHPSEISIPSSSCQEDIIDSEDESEPPTKKMTAKKAKPIVIKHKDNKGNLMGQSKPSPFSLLKPHTVKDITCTEGASNFTTYNLKNILTTSESSSARITPIIKETYSLSETPLEKVKLKKPIAEIAPQMKGDSKSNQVLQKSKGMMILKPEEINNRLTANLNESGVNFLEVKKEDNQMTMDIENFLATSIECTSPIIPDDVPDNETKYVERQGPAWRDVWIESRNIKGLGWIRGRKRFTDQWLSFEFPGFKFTEFYEEKEAFQKINQVLSRKVYIPKNIKPNWYVVETQEKLVSSDKINSHHFGSEYVLTTLGLRHKKELFSQKVNDE